MNRNGTYFKAVLMLIVFGMNAVVSSACSLRSILHEMHHRSEHAHHPTGRPHHHHHEEAEEHHAQPEDPSGNCCSSSIIELDQLDKLLSRAVSKTPLSFLVLYELPALREPVLHSSLISQTLRGWHDRRRAHPTIPDLRIAMQSFQI